VSLLQRFGNLRLQYKLVTILLVSFSVLTITGVIITRTNFGLLLRQTGQQQLEEEVGLLKKRLTEKEDEILNAARLLSSAPGLTDAISAGNTKAVRTAIVLQADPLQVDMMTVADSSKTRLLSITNASISPRLEDEERLLSLGLIGASTTGLIHEVGTENKLLLAGVTPVKDRTGAIIASVLVSRRIDDNFIDALDFSRADTHLAFIHQGKVAAADLSNPKGFSDLFDQQNPINQAEAGQVLIFSDPIADSDNIPNAYAYMPVRIGGTIQGVLSIRSEFTTLYNYQNQMVILTIVVTGVLALLIVITATIFARKTVIGTIQHLTGVSQKIAAGDFKQRVHVASGDEIGQLARSFNSMTDQLEQTMAQLEQRIAETQSARDEAERSNHVKSAFLASMSHELRTPLNSVINFTKFVAKGVMGPVNERQEEALNKASNSAKHLLQLINDVLDMSKIESGSLNLFVEENVDVGEIVQTVANTAEGMLTEKSVALQVDIDETLPRIVGDKKRILQILLNVVSNACKFTQEGHVTIKARQQDSEILLMVEDTGAGIALEDQTLVFEAFKQTDTGLRQGGGTGLGMPISRSLAEAHGGRLWFESAPGKGSTFYVSLPVKAEHLQPVVF
jgi:signal transduction histidine kinase